jgi:hypothetical protein
MINLVELAGLGRKVRQDDIDDLGAPTQDKILEALDDGRDGDARDLIAYMIPEGKALHDLFCDWLWDVFTKIADRHGEEEMHAIMKATQETWMMKRTWKAFRGMPAKTRLDLMAEIMRAHHGGPNQDGELTVTEDEDRYTLWMDPCGSGGRMRRGDPVDGTPSRLGPPYDFGVTSKAYPWSWGRKNVPYYCLHCANMEILPIEWGDAPLWVTEYSDDAERPCAWHFYKSPERIPDAIYARLGKERPGA